jgi:hypothetical protein
MNIEDIIKKISNQWNIISIAELQQISTIEKELGIVFPEDYKTFLKWSNGGEGYIGENYISLWKVENLIILNKEYQIQKYLSNSFLAIGTDGGGISYGFNVSNYTVFKCPFGDLDINEISIVAKSFKDFLIMSTTCSL